MYIGTSAPYQTSILYNVNGDKTLATWVAIKKSSKIENQIYSSSKTHRPPGRTNDAALLFYGNGMTITVRYAWMQDFARVLNEGLGDKKIDLGLG